MTITGRHVLLYLVLLIPIIFFSLKIVNDISGDIYDSNLLIIIFVLAIDFYFTFWLTFLLVIGSRFLIERLHGLLGHYRD